MQYQLHRTPSLVNHNPHRKSRSGVLTFFLISHFQQSRPALPIRGPNAAITVTTRTIYPDWARSVANVHKLLFASGRKVHLSLPTIGPKLSPCYKSTLPPPMA